MIGLTIDSNIIVGIEILWCTSTYYTSIIPYIKIITNIFKNQFNNNYNNLIQYNY